MSRYSRLWARLSRGNDECEVRPEPPTSKRQQAFRKAKTNLERSFSFFHSKSSQPLVNEQTPPLSFPPQQVIELSELNYDRSKTPKDTRSPSPPVFKPPVNEQPLPISLLQQEVTELSELNYDRPKTPEDTRPPLPPMFKPLPRVERITCVTCTRSLRPGFFPPVAREHVSESCSICWYDWLEAQLETTAVNSIECLQCNRVLEQADVRELGREEIYGRYLNLQLVATMSHLPGFRACNVGNCRSGQIHTEGHIFTCIACGEKACVECDVPWHMDETCADFQAKMKRMKMAWTLEEVEFGKRIEEEASVKKIEETTKKCPQCKTRIEKNRGCDHMTCTRCEHEFCWDCGAPQVPSFEEGNHLHQVDCKHWRALGDVRWA